MNIIVADTYEHLSKLAAEDIIALLQPVQHPLICPASGDSPTGLYQELVKNIQTQHIDVSQWYFVSLDEWAGMNGTDEGSCRYYLNNYLFNPLQVPAERIGFFDGRATDLQAECKKVEDFIDRHGGIELAIVGLGMNGHVGMNEPGTSAKLRSHIADIDPVTQKTGQKYFKKQQQLTHGVTLGLATIMEARHVVLMVNGRHKAEMVQRALEGEISEALPATLLRNHPGLKVYLDAAAASKLNQQVKNA